jgi:hypothetical protein
MPRRSCISLPRIPLHIIQRRNYHQVCFFTDEDYLAWSLEPVCTSSLNPRRNRLPQEIYCIPAFAGMKSKSVYLKVFIPLTVFSQ